jgi:hypothetical protein
MRKKGTFTRYVDFFFLSSFLIGFLYHRQKKMGVYRTSAVRSFVCPSGRHTFSSLRHTFEVSISEL